MDASAPWAYLDERPRRGFRGDRWIPAQAYIKFRHPVSKFSPVGIFRHSTL
jgi:hypothetical protein